MLTAYDTTHILAREPLRQVGAAVGVRYLALPILVTWHEAQSPRLTALGLQAVKTVSATARFELQLWDTRSGRVVWEGFSELTLAEDLIRERPVPFAALIQATWETLLQHLPAEPVLLPPAAAADQ